MKKKIFIIIIFILILGGCIFTLVKNKKIVNKNNNTIKEYVPEVEISDKELRKTLVTLYFVNNDGKIESEERAVDSKKLLINPYISLVQMLIDGPEREGLNKIIPNGTKVIDAKIEKNRVIINLSKEFIDNADGDVTKKCNMIYTIVNTLTELNEVQSVKFLIDGEETEGFKEDAIKLTNEFARTEFK